MSSFRFFGCFTRHYKKKSTPEVPNEVREVFVKYAENGVMGTDGLLRFLREVQGEMGATLETARVLMEKQQQQEQQKQQQLLQGLPQLQPHRKQEQQGLSFESFFDLLINASLNAAYSSGTVDQEEMREPLAHYFIYTGHNSYLTGNQLNSKCSVEPIKAALKQGVRAIELDLWPNSAKDEIQVLHGNTLTAPVEFDKCISAINENAFVTSQYPVIITLEDHLTSNLQKKAAEILMAILGSTLYQPNTEEAMTQFPDPELLKGRIIVSTKPPKEYLEAEMTTSAIPSIKKLEKEDVLEEQVEELVKDEFEDGWGQENPGFCHDQAPHPPVDKDDTLEVSSCVPNITASNNGLLEQAMAVTAVDDDDDEMIEENIPNGKINSSYTRLITIRSGKPSGFSIHQVLTLKEAAVRRISLSEQVLEKVAKSYPNDLVL
jgi:phosphatidylinositol phospholipase C delta